MSHSRTTSRIVRSGTADLAVRQVGDEGPSLVLVHGLGDNQRSWERVIRHLAGRFRLVTYDLRGHGRSSVGDGYDVETLLGDLATVVDALDLQRPLLSGHSLGGLLAVEYAATSSCAGVVAVEGGLSIERPSMDWDAVAAHMARPAYRLMSRVLVTFGLGSRLTLVDIQQLTEQAEARERRLDDAYRRIACPLLVVLGSRADPVPHGQEVRTAIRTAADHLRLTHPEVEIAWLDCGHLIPLQRPRELAGLIIAFAAGPEPPRR
jgi:pimeloyl-ACP methyl ester carboxylesterase